VEEGSLSTGGRAVCAYFTESRKAIASAAMAVASSIGRIGVAVKLSRVVHGAVVRASAPPSCTGLTSGILIDLRALAWLS